METIKMHLACAYFSIPRGWGKHLPFILLAITTTGFSNVALANHVPNWTYLNEHQVNRQNIQQAIINAKNYFNSHRGQTGLNYRITLAAGRFNIRPDPGEIIPERKGLIEFNNFDPGEGNKLYISGMGMFTTTLVFPVANTNVSGRNASRIQFEKLHFTKDRLKVSQGRVIRITPGKEVVLKLQLGFPSLAVFPKGIFTRDTEPGSRIDRGRKLRRYVMIPDPDNPGRMKPSYWRFDSRIPGGIPWASARKLLQNDVADRRWIITLNDPEKYIHYFEVGQNIGIKSKHGGQAYQFVNGEDISFVGVQWTHETRGIFRGVDNVTVRYCRAGPDAAYLRRGIVPYLASPGGGPQVGAPMDNPLNWAWLGNPVDINDLNDRHGVLAKNGGSNHRIEGNVFTRLGDDPIGIFNVEKNVQVLGNTLIEGPARGTLNYNICGFYSHVNGLRSGSNYNNYINSWPLDESQVTADRLFGNWRPETITRLCEKWKRDAGY